MRRAPLGREIDRAAGTADLLGSILASGEYRERIAARCDRASLRYCARPAPAGEPTELSTLVPEPPLVLEDDPAGTVIDRAYSLPSPPEYRPWLHTLYGEPGRDDPADGRALVVGTAYEDSPVPHPATGGFRPVTTEDGRTLGVGTDRAWTWAVWSGSGCECIAYVAGRELAEAEVVAAARSVRGEPGQLRPRIAPEGRPAGLEPLVAGPVHPQLVEGLGDSQRTSYRTPVRDEGIDLALTRSDPRLAWLLRFWIDAGRLAVPIDGEAPVAAVRYGEGIVSTATADPGVADEEDLFRLLDAVRPAASGEWAGLQERARDEADIAQLCSGLSPPAAVLEGLVGAVRWGVAFDEQGGTCDVLLLPGRQFDSLGQSGGGDEEPGLSVLPLFISGGDFDGVLITGDAPAGTATVRVEDAGRPPLEALLADRGDRPGERWYAAFLATSGIRPLTAVALDAQGRELARLNSG